MLRSESPRDPPARCVVRGNLEPHAIALGDPDVVNVQSAAALGENGSAMSSGQIFDRIEAAPTAFRDDSFENEKVPLARRFAVQHSSPDSGGPSGPQTPHDSSMRRSKPEPRVRSPIDPQ